MKQFNVFFIGGICLSLLGCNLESGQCTYNDKNDFEQKCENGRHYYCLRDNYWETEDCQLGCNAAGTECYRCTPKCENGQLKLCKADGSNYETPIICELGCNSEGNDCNGCTNKCENGKLSECKFDRSGYKTPIDCIQGCNEEGTDCKTDCTEDLCKDGVLYHCKDNKLANYGEKCPVLKFGVAGACANTTECKQCDETNTDDSMSLRQKCVSENEYVECKDGLWDKTKQPCNEATPYCNSNTSACSDQKNDANCEDREWNWGWGWGGGNGGFLLKENQYCPDNVSCNADKSDCGVCKNSSTKCEENVSYKCEQGEFHELDCPFGCHTDWFGNSICNDCNANQCNNNESKVGNIKTCTDGTYGQPSECKVNNASTSCQSETECGECLNDTVQCKDNFTLQVCRSGKWEDTKCNSNKICDSVTKQCTNSCSVGAKRCEGNELQTCNKDGEWVKSQTCDKGCSNLACNVCVNNETKCESGSLKTCKSGQWNSQSCGYGCYDDSQCNVCPKDTVECKNSKLRTCLGTEWKEETCEYGCGDDKKCMICKPGTIECVASKNAKVCTDRGEWGPISCPGGCSKNECFECVPDSKQCNANDVQICNKQGKWEKSETCEKGCTAGACNECTVAENECKDDTLKTCENGKLVIDNCQGLGCFNATKCNVCPIGYKECIDDKTLGTCTGDAIKETKCDYKCYEASESGYNPRCLEECIPDTIDCVYTNNALKCSQDGGWFEINCPGGCTEVNGTDVCYP